MRHMMIVQAVHDWGVQNIASHVIGHLLHAGINMTLGTLVVLLGKM